MDTGALVSVSTKNEMFKNFKNNKDPLNEEIRKKLKEII